MIRKIAYFIDSDDPGGAENLVIKICRGLNRKKFIPVVYHFGNRWLQKKCNECGIHSVLVPGHSLYKSIKTIPLFSLIFARFLFQQNVDILHSHLFGSITGASFSAFLAKIPHIGTLHDIYTVEENKTKFRLLQLSSLLGTRLITVSQYMHNYFNSLGKLPKGSFYTILNGVDLKEFNGNIDLKKRSGLGLGSDETILICVGRLVKIKGYNILIEAISLLHSDVAFKLIIVGDGPDRENIEYLISQKRLKGKVKLLGQKDDVPDLLKLSDCFVLSSYSEGLSCSIIEAMAAGLPVVATDVGGNRELVKDGVSGYIVPPGDATVFAKRLQSIINDKNKRKSFGNMAFNIAKNNFSIEKMMNEYVCQYIEMTANGKI